DKDDECPNVAGTVNGCPDTDGDGVADKDDECVDVAGSAANNGCPEVTDEDMTKIEELFETVYFHFDKATLKPSAEEKLDENVTIMNKYQNTKFFIEGHTDSIGSNAYNLDLSERRAASVKNYLISKGVSASNLESKGYGETQPIDTNDTDAGRAKNRRVEVKLEK
ncbi:MAG TPA: OmpA family protein, partial [Flavobacteriaceae bacterium]|nr:OmpA family protein [Flavobacteriaceae bacterium]